ncbi:hypothetical protein [Bacillus infantis]|uniref:hypothetical protein n=1 Tax=Bacillus infantis TaxID=324767 RepID=UPI003CF417A0
MEKNNYHLEILYKSGVIETYDTGEAEEDALNGVANTFDQAFSEGLNAVVTIPSSSGATFINVSSVARVSFIK